MPEKLSRHPPIKGLCLILFCLMVRNSDAIKQQKNLIYETEKPKSVVSLNDSVWGRVLNASQPADQNISNIVFFVGSWILSTKDVPVDCRFSGLTLEYCPLKITFFLPGGESRWNFLTLVRLTLDFSEKGPKNYFLSQKTVKTRIIGNLHWLLLDL